MDAKQVIVIRRDLGMRRGKEIAQGAHASLGWLTERIRNSPGSARTAEVTFTDAEYAWLAGWNREAEPVDGAFTKVVCQVPGEETLLAVLSRAEQAGVNVYLVTDAGRTEFHGESVNTAVAVGPDWADVIDTITGDLKLY